MHIGWLNSRKIGSKLLFHHDITYKEHKSMQQHFVEYFCVHGTPYLFGTKSNNWKYLNHTHIHVCMHTHTILAIYIYIYIYISPAWHDWIVCYHFYELQLLKHIFCLITEAQIIKIEKRELVLKMKPKL